MIELKDAKKIRQERRVEGLIFGAVMWLTIPLVYFWIAWWAMLGLGAIHHDVSTRVPALGFWGTYVVLLGARAVCSVFRAWSKDK